MFFLGVFSDTWRIYKSPNSRDSFLIARSMLDGAMLFDWITLGPDAESRKLYVKDNFPFQ